MAYPIAADYDLLAPSDLAPQPIHADVMDRMGRNLNWLYLNHTPALSAFAVPGVGSYTDGLWGWAARPSADGLLHTMVLSLTTAAQNYVTYGLATADVWGGSWTTRISGSQAMATGSGWITDTGYIPGSVRYFRLTTHTAAGNSWESPDGTIESFLLYPSPTVLPAVGTTLPSGVTLYNDTALSATGAAIHTEYADRIWQGAALILQDRRQVVHSLVSGPDRTWTGTTNAPTVQVLHGTAIMPAQSTCTLTIRYRMADTRTPGPITLGQVGGESVALTADNLDRVTTLRVHGPEVELYCDANPGGDMTVPYLVADWAPGD